MFVSTTGLKEVRRLTEDLMDIPAYIPCDVSDTYNHVNQSVTVLLIRQPLEKLTNTKEVLRGDSCHTIRGYRG